MSAECKWCADGMREICGHDPHRCILCGDFFNKHDVTVGVWRERRAHEECQRRQEVAT